MPKPLTSKQLLALPLGLPVSVDAHIYDREREVDDVLVGPAFIIHQERSGFHSWSVQDAKGRDLHMDFEEHSLLSNGHFCPESWDVSFFSRTPGQEKSEELEPGDLVQVSAEGRPLLARPMSLVALLPDRVLGDLDGVRIGLALGPEIAVLAAEPAPPR